MWLAMQDTNILVQKTLFITYSDFNYRILKSALLPTCISLAVLIYDDTASYIPYWIQRRKVKESTST
jgi:hypothetical protein